MATAVYRRKFSLTGLIIASGMTITLLAALGILMSNVR
jgi:hypothetical protein